MLGSLKGIGLGALLGPALFTLPESLESLDALAAILSPLGIPGLLGVALLLLQCADCLASTSHELPLKALFKLIESGGEGTVEPREQVGGLVPDRIEEALERTGEGVFDFGG